MRPIIPIKPKIFVAGGIQIPVFVAGKCGIVRIRFQDENQRAYDIGLDAVTSRNGSDTSTATQYATSAGTPVVDNVYRNPMEFTFSGEVGIESGVSDGYGSGAERPKNFRDLLELIKNSAYQLTIETPDKTYDNMYLLEIGSANSDANAYSSAVTLKFRELPRATTEYGTVEVAYQVSHQTTTTTEIGESKANKEADKAQANLSTPVTITIKSVLGNLFEISGDGRWLGVGLLKKFKDWIWK